MTRGSPDTGISGWFCTQPASCVSGLTPSELGTPSAAFPTITLGAVLTVPRLTAGTGSATAIRRRSTPGLCGPCAAYTARYRSAPSRPGRRYGRRRHSRTVRSWACCLGVLGDLTAGVSALRRFLRDALRPKPVVFVTHELLFILGHFAFLSGVAAVHTDIRTSSVRNAVARLSVGLRRNSQYSGCARKHSSQNPRGDTSIWSRLAAGRKGEFVQDIACSDHLAPPMCSFDGGDCSAPSLGGQSRRTSAINAKDVPVSAPRAAAQAAIDNARCDNGLGAQPSRRQRGQHRGYPLRVRPIDSAGSARLL